MTRTTKISSIIPTIFDYNRLKIHAKKLVKDYTIYREGKSIKGI